MKRYGRFDFSGGAKSSRGVTGTVEQVDPYSFRVGSGTSPFVSYTVLHTAIGWTCTCKNFQHPAEGQEPGSCKHIRAVQNQYTEDAVTEGYELKPDHSSNFSFNTYNQNFTRKTSDLYGYGSSEAVTVTPKAWAPAGFICTCAAFQAGNDGLCFHISDVSRNWQPKTTPKGFRKA